MIDCRAVSKAFGEQTLFTDFTYRFPDIGLILLLGESGCGKTTLLNILAGLAPFDSGTVAWGGDVYTGRVDAAAIGSRLGYITQDSHFVDYLTVWDNLLLCTTNDGEAERLLLEYGLEDKRSQYPRQLSGGEKQRLAVLRMLLAHKPVLFLDEPTASLDQENKLALLRMLDTLKQTHLIVCCTHDEEARKFADDILDFHQLPHSTDGMGDKAAGTDVGEPPAAPAPSPRRPLQPFMNKWRRFPGRERRSGVFLTLVLLLTFLAVGLGDTPQHKSDTNMEYMYHVTQMVVVCYPGSDYRGDIAGL